MSFPVQVGSAAPSAVQHVKLLLEKGNPALEILTTTPVTPHFTPSDDAMRVVFELPNTNMSVPDRVVPIKNRDLSEMHLSLRNTTPPTVQVEVDFRTPLVYSLDASGNRLLVSFHEVNKSKVSGAVPPSSPATGITPTPVSAPAEAPDLAYVVPVEHVASGSSITADAETTVLRVKHEGDVYVCPQTTVSVVHSKNGPDLMLAIDGGGLETHLALRDSADEVVTPDFRILLRGPGDFHYAIRSDSRGNTCVRTLPGNTASAIIYELLGDGTYNVQAGDQLVFHDGKLTSDGTHSQNVLPVECGCPPPAHPTLMASIKPDPQIAVGDTPGQPAVALKSSSDSTAASTPKPATTGNFPAQDSAIETPSLNQTPVQVEASLTFTPNPARLAASQLPASSRELYSPVDVAPPSAPSTPQPRKSVFGKLKSFFSGVFH